MARPRKVEVTPEQPVPVDVGDEEEVKAQEQVAETETEVEEPESEPVVVQEEEPQDESALRKRLEEQIRAEILAEQSRKDAAAQQEYQRELAEERQRTQDASQRYQTELRAKHNANYENVISNLGAAQAEAEVAKRDLRAAKHAGDIDAEVDASARLGEATSRIGPLEQRKMEWDNWFEQQRNAPQQQPQRQQDPLEARISNMAEPAKQWFRQHRDYAMDPTKSAAVVHHHHQAVAQGLRELSPEYFEFVETALGMRQKPEAREIKRERSTVVAAPVTREAPSSNGSKGPTTIQLTSHEREIARASKISPTETDAQAENRYARNKLRLINGKKDGSIQ